MNHTNRHGLSRHIPEAIARSIRKRCGFGCVKCGRAIYEYHHFDPPFEDAKEHREDGITLLCPNCHADQQKGLLSRGAVEQSNENPKCLERGFSSRWLDLKGSPNVVLGHITFINTPNMIEAFGESLLAIEGPGDSNAPFSLSAVFHDASGREIARIRRNEWQGNAENWDIKNEGNKFIIRERLGKASLVLRVNPPSSLTVERLDMFYRGLRIVASLGEDRTVFLVNGEVWFETPGMRIISSAHGIVLR